MQARGQHRQLEQRAKEWPHLFCLAFWSLTCRPLRSFQAAAFLVLCLSSFFRDLNRHTVMHKSSPCIAMAAEDSAESKKWSWNAQQRAPSVAGDHVFCDASRVSSFPTTDLPHGSMLTLRGAWGRPGCAPPWRAPEQHPTHPAPLPAALHRSLRL